MNFFRIILNLNPYSKSNLVTTVYFNNDKQIILINWTLATLNSDLSILFSARIGDSTTKCARFCYQICSLFHQVWYEYVNDILIINNKLLITKVKGCNPSLCMLKPYKGEPHCNTLSSSINILLFYSQSWKMDWFLNSTTKLSCSKV